MEGPPTVFSAFLPLPCRLIYFLSRIFFFIRVLHILFFVIRLVLSDCSLFVHISIKGNIYHIFFIDCKSCTQINSLTSSSSYINFFAEYPSVIIFLATQYFAAMIIFSWNTSFIFLTLSGYPKDCFQYSRLIPTRSPDYLAAAERKWLWTKSKSLESF